MRIVSAKAENFLSYKEFDYNFEDKGLTLIEGKDLDLGVNTGAGKSAFLDVICYGLFGMTSKKLKSDEVINWNVKKNLMVTLAIEHQGNHYIIHRYRKHKDHDNDFYILRNDDQVPIRGKDSKETQKVLDGILGFNAEIFTKSVYFGQFDNVDKFLSATDIKKKELISEICDLSAYDEMLDLVKLDLKDQKEFLVALDSKIIPIESKNNTLITKKDEMILSSERWLVSNKEEADELKIKSESFKIELQNKIVKVKGLIDNFNLDKSNELKAIDVNINEFESDRQVKVKSIQDKIQKFKDDNALKISRAKEQSEVYEKSRENIVLGLNNEKDTISLKINEIKENISNTLIPKSIDIDQEEQQLISKLDHFKVVDSEIKDLELKKALLVNDNNKLRAEITSEKEKANNNIGGDCPFCHQEMTSHSMEKHINNLISSGLSNKKDIEEIDSQINQKQMIYNQKDLVDKELEIVKQKRQEAIKAEFELKNLNSQLESLNNSLADKDKQITEHQGNLNPYLAQMESLSLEKHGFTGEIERIIYEVNPYLRHKEAKQAEENPYFKQLEELDNTNNPYPNMINTVEKKVNPFTDSIKSTEEEVNQLTLKLDELNKNRDLITSEIDKGIFWKDALGVYIKSYLMDSFLSQLNEQANIYLETLFNGVLRVQIDSVTESKKKTKEKISQKIYNGNVECSYESLSGGERCRICLAINLALSDITCKTLGDSFSILMLDEILTGLDSSGKAQTMRLLKELEAKFDTIFVIDHTEEFKSLFTNNITITKKGGFSNINQ